MEYAYLLKQGQRILSDIPFYVKKTLLDTDHL